LVVKAPVSVVVITRDEEPNILRCLAGVKWAAEVIVVDALSSDRTARIAAAHGATVIRREWPGYGPQKNFGIRQASQPWLFSLDADEVVTPELGQEIRRVIGLRDNRAAYALPVLTYFKGQALPYYGRAHQEPAQIRLFRKAAGWFNDRLVGERVEIEGQVGTLGEPLLHYPYAAEGAYWRTIRLYADLEAQQRLRDGARSGSPWLRAAGTFAWMFLWRRGVIDGRVAWTWIAGQVYGEFLATREVRRLGRAPVTGTPQLAGQSLRG
jgi:glycosyltransferase involved in cell wall biosynthesis